MPDDRRSFIKRFGVTLGSLIVSGSISGCGLNRDEGLSHSGSHDARQDEPSRIPRAPDWGQLRQCWLNLKSEDTRNTLNESHSGAWTQDSDPFTTATDVLAKRHQAILSTLVAKCQVKEPVAQCMQIAFEEAAYHVVRSMATCYMIYPFEYKVRGDLLQQADMLRKVSGDLDPVTVAKAQAAIAQDMVYFEILKSRPSSYESLRDKYKAGNIEASPEALEAARLLTELLLETRN